MSGILVFCKECGKQVPSSETRDGRCLDCQVRKSVADLRDEHARLWRKRERYRTSQANIGQIARQIARVEDRMAYAVGALHRAVREHDSAIHREIRPFTDCPVNDFDDPVAILRMIAPGMFFV